MIHLLLNRASSLFQGHVPRFPEPTQVGVQQNKARSARNIYLLWKAAEPASSFSCVYFLGPHPFAEIACLLFLLKQECRVFCQGDPSSSSSSF